MLASSSWRTWVREARRERNGIPPERGLGGGTSGAGEDNVSQGALFGFLRRLLGDAARPNPAQILARRSARHGGRARLKRPFPDLVIGRQHEAVPDFGEGEPVQLLERPHRQRPVGVGGRIARAAPGPEWRSEKPLADPRAKRARLDAGAFTQFLEFEFFVGHAGNLGSEKRHVKMSFS